MYIKSPTDQSERGDITKARTKGGLTQPGKHHGTNLQQKQKGRILQGHASGFLKGQTRLETKEPHAQNPKLKKGKEQA